MNGDGEKPIEELPDRSPFATPAPEPERSSEINSGPSVYDEPWMRADREMFQAPPEPIGGLNQAVTSPDAENSVWDEPALSPELSGKVPDGALTWYRWFTEQAALTSETTTWLVTVAISLAAGIWAILGALSLQTSWQFPVIMAVFVAPVTEEIMKIALAIWVAEKRPWLFKSFVQIVICGIASGLVFAAIENVIYLNVYIQNPSPQHVQWRWTICVMLHTGCSTIASIGVVQVWQRFQNEKRIPRLSDGARWIVAAMIIHGLYNLAASTMALVEQ